jgi:hypothetical protein
MNKSVLIWLGSALTLACFALLVAGYAPEVFRRHDEKVDVVALAPKCATAVAVDLKLLFQAPAFWSATTGATLIVPKINRCKSFWLSTTNRAATVRLWSSEAVFKGEKREINRVLAAQKSDGPSQIYEVSTEGLSEHWSLSIENAFTATRSGFDRYEAEGDLSLTIGYWSLRAEPAPAYSITGTSDWVMKVVSEARPEDRDLLFQTGAVFSRITENKDIFGILISTLLGLGLATVVQGLAMESERRRRRRAGPDQPNAG